MHTHGVLRMWEFLDNQSDVGDPASASHCSWMANVHDDSVTFSSCSGWMIFERLSMINFLVHTRPFWRVWDFEDNQSDARALAS